MVHMSAHGSTLGWVFNPMRPYEHYCRSACSLVCQYRQLWQLSIEDHDTNTPDATLLHSCSNPTGVQEPSGYVVVLQYLPVSTID
jgi:hypothetical protein